MIRKKLTKELAIQADANARISDPCRLGKTSACLKDLRV